MLVFDLPYGTFYLLSCLCAGYLLTFDRIRRFTRIEYEGTLDDMFYLPKVHRVPHNNIKHLSILVLFSCSTTGAAEHYQEVGIMTRPGLV